MVIPIKDEKDNLPRLHDALHAALDPLLASGRLRDFEVVLVDDGSIDGSIDVLHRLAREDRRVKVVILTRNYGQTPALRAGIDWSRGDVIVTMDGDLQNDPADIPMLLGHLADGYDAVFGLRKKRQDGLFLRKLPSLAGNWLIRWVTGVTVKDMGCTLRAMRRELAEALPLYGELHRFVPVLAKMHGARVMQVDVAHHPRTAGRTKYARTFSRSIRVFLDLITVKFLHTFMTRPMHALGLPGLVCMAMGLVTLLATVWMKYASSNPVFLTGNPLLHLSVMLEMMGAQFLSMGLLGEMLARTYFESQGKSAYTVRTTLNVEPREHRRAA